MANTEVTCDRCKTSRPYYHVTEQRDREMLCYVCVNEHNARLRDEARKARSEAPRCECCNRRGTWKVSGVLLCGVHKNRVQRNRDRDLARHGGMALVVALSSPVLSRDEILTLAES